MKFNLFGIVAFACTIQAAVVTPQSNDKLAARGKRLGVSF